MAQEGVVFCFFVFFDAMLEERSVSLNYINKTEVVSKAAGFVKGTWAVVSRAYPGGTFRSSCFLLN